MGAGTKGEVAYYQIDAEMTEKYDITREDYRSRWNILRSQLFVDKNMQTFFPRLLRKSLYHNAYV